MKRVWHKKRSRFLVVGACKLPRHAPMGPRLKDFVHAATAFPSSPASRDWSAPAMSVITNELGNDVAGNCVEAEEGHFLGVETGNANTLFACTTRQILDIYSKITGYNPNDPNTDQGTDPIVCLNYFTQNAYPDGTKLAGYALVDCANVDEVKFAINTFGNLKLWFGIPDSITNNLGSLEPGFVWDASAGPADQNNGHCIGSCGYNPATIQAVGVTAQGVLVMTWGMLGLVTWAALAQWFVPSAGGGGAVRLTTDWVSKASGNAPSGLSYAALVQACNLYFGTSIPVPPAPVPTPPPGPPPTAPPTLAQATAACQSALAAAHPLLLRSQAETIVTAALAPLWPAP